MKLFKVSEEEYIFVYNVSGARYCPTVEDLFVWVRALWEKKLTNVNLDELEIAVVELERNNHNYAEFGEFKGSFIYSKKI